MPSLRALCKTAFALAVFTILALGQPRSHAQGALLLEQPYGFFGTLNPTGHNAIYLRRVCAETPVKLRRCDSGELGVVISRYQGIGDYDWVAMPLIPYLYSVETANSVPSHVDRATVRQLRQRYFETHLEGLADHLPPGNLIRGGWTQLVGLAYERRIYAFRFETTEEQDDALIARLNAAKNISHFDLFYNNCADFSRSILNGYFPRTFKRSFFPDAWMTTPKQIAYKLVRYSKKHPETKLTVLEIPQIPGYRRHSGSNKSIAESLTTTGYAAPIAIFNPYLAGGLLIDYLARGRFLSTPKDPKILAPGNLVALTATTPDAQNADSEITQTPRAVPGSAAELPSGGQCEDKGSQELQ